MQISLNNFTAIVSPTTGASLVLYANEVEYYDDEIKQLKKLKLDSTSILDKNYRYQTITICLSLTKKCNLNCRYCFNKNKHNKSLPLLDAISFIDYIIDNTPYAERYIVDLAGSGEPLLELNNILAIAKHCYEKSNEICKHVMPQLVCNGTLLTTETVQKLRDAGILFGISIDGTKKDHDINRIDFANKGTFKTIITNIKNIKDRSFIGAAVTLNNDNLHILKTFKFLSKYFDTVCLKIVRPDDTYHLDVETIKKEYSKLNAFLIKTIRRRDTSYLLKLLNGDDFYAKFILRVLFNIPVLSRCDAGLGKFAIDADKQIYGCSGAVGISSLCLGKLGEDIDFDFARKLQTKCNVSNKCKHCPYLYICGGECLVNYTSKEKPIDEMCEIKTHLIKEALLLKGVITNERPEIYDELERFSEEKSNRDVADKELLAKAEKYKDKYTFMEMKFIKDNNPEEYKKL